jgi:predicted small lipoprotein YifL
MRIIISIAISAALLASLAACGNTAPPPESVSQVQSPRQPEDTNNLPSRGESETIMPTGEVDAMSYGEYFSQSRDVDFVYSPLKREADGTEVFIYDEGNINDRWDGYDYVNAASGAVDGYLYIGKLAANDSGGIFYEFFPLLEDRVTVLFEYAGSKIYASRANKFTSLIPAEHRDKYNAHAPCSAAQLIVEVT